MKSAKNDVTGDSIKTKASNPDAYAKGWDRIFGGKYKPQQKRLRTLLNSSKRNGSLENDDAKGML
jgi:hypothetical protein